MPRMHRTATLSRRLILMLPAALPMGCAGPLDRTAEEQFREELIAAQRQQLAARSAGTVEIVRTPSEVEQQLEEEGRIEVLDAMSGPQAYDQLTPEVIGPDLLGEEGAEIVRISLPEAIQQAVEHNLPLAVARLGPAIAETQVEAAEAAFDWLFFTDAEWSKLDTPQPAGSITGLSGDQRDERWSVTPGLSKPLYSGGRFDIQTSLSRIEEDPSFFITPSYYDADVLVSLTQPLLRGLGSDVNRAEIYLAENARRAEVENLKQTLLDLAFSVEQAYWDLVLAQQRVMIQSRLLERTIEDRNRLLPRIEFDVSPVRITEANSFVELRRADVIRAQAALRQASDALKRLINAPGMPLTDETLLIATDTPAETPISFNLSEAVTTAIRTRPELERALLDISDAAIRLRVADNALLPILDVRAAVGVNGIDSDNAGGAYDSLGQLEYIDYILSGRFEYPLGNRAAESLQTARRLEQQQAALNYRNLVQARVLEIKNALRAVLTTYQLIGATRAARRAAADSLRAIEEQEAAGVALTPEFLLDLKLRTQERLAEAELQEIEAITNYNTAIAAFYEAVGTLLDRNGIGYADDSAVD